MKSETPSISTVDRFFDYSNPYCPWCMDFLPPPAPTGLFEFRKYWWFEQIQQSHECGFERGYWQRVSIFKILNIILENTKNL